jgi:hypothetical protein
METINENSLEVGSCVGSNLIWEKKNISGGFWHKVLWCYAVMLNGLNKRLYWDWYYSFAISKDY